MGVFGCGLDTIAQLLITARDNPERLRREAAFAALTGVSPIPASLGKTNRHRLNRAGDRQANWRKEIEVLIVAAATTAKVEANNTAIKHIKEQAGDSPMPATIKRVSCCAVPMNIPYGRTFTTNREEPEMASDKL
jgi:hypothetical protein